MICPQCNERAAARCDICGLCMSCCTLPIYADVEGQKTINRTRENLQQHQEDVWKAKESHG